MGALTPPLYVCGAGAVTPAGLTAPQTCAAIRAGLSAFEEHIRSDPFGAVQIVARIPSHWRLRRTAGEWLVNMAARAIDEALATGQAGAQDTALFLTPPESFRDHPAYADIPPAGFLAAVTAAVGQRFHPASRAFDGGAAAALGLIEQAGAAIAAGAAQVLLGGVDSLVNDTDFKRLGAAGRLRGDANAQGLVPGEAAAFVRLTRAPDRARPVHAAILATGAAREADTALGERFSQGTALLQALRAAVDAPGCAEAELDFVVSNGNGERYSAWEEMIARPRFYRTRREMLPIAYPAMTLGDVGAAGAALALMLAADAFAHDYAPGARAICEIASEGGLRAAAVVTRTTG